VFLRKTINIDKNIASKFSWEILFLGIDENIEIYFNNQFVGKYLGSMTPFTAQIPQRFFRDNNNKIKFIITAAENASAQIKNQNIFAKKIYTGVLRDMLLVGNPSVYFSNINYTTDLINGNWKVNSFISLSTGNIDDLVLRNRFNDSLSNVGISKANVKVEGRITNKQTGALISSFENSNVEIESYRTIDLKFSNSVYGPTLWSPDNPYLYDMNLTVSRNGVVIDKRTINLGFVHYRVLKNGQTSLLLINGKKTQIKGITYVENYKEGRRISFEAMERDIKHIKSNLGANLIRVKYHSPHPYLAKLCDKYGLLLQIDLPIYDIPQSVYGLDEIKVKMRNLGDRYVNTYGINPSVMAWGLYDNVGGSNKETSEFLIKTLSRQSNKLLYKTVLFGTKNIDTTGIDFIGLRDNHKLMSIDEIRKEIERLTELSPGIPAYVEFGFPIKPDNRNGYSDPLSLESQAYYILNLFHIAESKKLIGSIIATYRDYYLQNPMMIVNNENAYLFSGGLIDIYGKQRLSFRTTQALFKNEKEPLMNAGSYSETTPISFIVIGLIFTVLIIFYVNRYKRFREYFIRAFIRPFNFFADIRDQRIISNIQTIILGFILALSVGIYMSSILYYFKIDTITQLILLLVVPTQFLREFLFTIIWIPELLMITITFIVFVAFFVLAGVIRLTALFIRGRIFFKDTLTIVIWSALPLLLLLPVSIILIKLLVFSPAFIWVLLIAVNLLNVWILIRILKAIGIVFDTNPTKTYAIGLSVFVVIILTVVSFYQLEYSIFYYTDFILKNL